MMGIAEVVPALPRILDAMDALRDAARDRRPRAALLIDSPDFNLRLARRLRELRIPVAYFIGPAVWAWRRYRVRQIARDVTRMLVILPFEERSTRSMPSKRSTWETRSATHFAEALRHPARAPAGVLALLPGSRVQEIRRIWPPMLEAARLLKARHPALRLVLPVAPTIDRKLLGDVPDVELVDAQAPEVLARANAAIVASGTATLEAALTLTPLVVVYSTAGSPGGSAASWCACASFRWSTSSPAAQSCRSCCRQTARPPASPPPPSRSCPLPRSERRRSKRCDPSGRSSRPQVRPARHVAPPRRCSHWWRPASRERESRLRGPADVQRAREPAADRSRHPGRLTGAGRAGGGR